MNDFRLITHSIFTDSRGFFTELWNCDRLPFDVRQINHSCTKLHALRGLHFRDGEEKLVSVVSGKIFDVVVDVRYGSPTFGRYNSFILSSGNQLYIPSGFAHGFQAIEDNSNVVYLTNKTYNKDLNKALIWNDPLIGIEWHAVPSSISEQDLLNPSLDQYVKGLGNGI